MELSFSDSVVVECLPGYSFTGYNDPQDTITRITGLFDGSLSAFSACRPISCGPPPLVHNAAEAPDATHEFVYGDQAKYSCKDGYTLDGTSMGSKTLEIGCPATGLWEAPMHCQPVHCGSPPGIKDGSVDQVEIVYPGEVSYHCNSGYSFDPFEVAKTSFVRKCLASGEFESVPFGYRSETGEVQCHKVTCGQPPAVAEAEHVEGERSFGETATYHCKDGYSLDGTSGGHTSWSILCTENGQFAAGVIAAESCQRIGFSVAGSVLEGRTMHALAGAKVTLSLGDLSFETTATTDDMGIFSADKVPSGQVTMKVEKAGYVAKEKLITLQDHVMSGEAADMALSPELPPDAYQIKLAWDPPAGGQYVQAYTNEECEGSMIANVSDDRPIGVLENKGACEHTCTSNPDCSYFLYKECPDCITKYTCVTFTNCERRITTQDGSPVIYKKEPLPDMDAELEFGDRLACVSDHRTTNVECNGMRAILDFADSQPYSEVTSILDVTSACADKATGECLLKYSVTNFGKNPVLSASGSHVEVYQGRTLKASFKAADAVAGSDAGIIDGSKWEIFVLDGKTGEITPMGKVTTCVPVPKFTVYYEPIPSGRKMGNYWCNPKPGEKKRDNELTNVAGTEPVGPLQSKEACACECQKLKDCSYFLYKFDPRERKPYRCVTWGHCDNPEWSARLKSSWIYAIG